MKKLLLFLFLGFLPQIIHAQSETAKAVLGNPQEIGENGEYQDVIAPDGNTYYTLYFLYNTSSYTANKSYDIETIDGKTEHVKVYKPFGVSLTKKYNDLDDDRAPWRKDTGWRHVDRVVITDSFKDCSSKYYDWWFGAGTGTNSNNGTSSNRTTSLKKVVGGSNLNTTSAVSLDELFREQQYLEEIDDVSTWLPEGNQVTNLHAMFYNCKKLQALDVSNWDVSKVTGGTRPYTTNNGNPNYDGMRLLFAGCESLTTLDVSKWNPSSAVNMFGMFRGCKKIKILDFSEWSNNTVVLMPEMFKGCECLERIKFGNDFNTKNVTYTQDMFNGCKNLKSIIFGGNFTMNKVSADKSADMFANCPNLRYIDFHECNYSITGTQKPLNSVNRKSNTFNGVPETTVIYMPHGNSYGTGVTNVRNVVYPYNGNDTDLRCHDYYSEDKVDIEFPRDFITNEATYTRKNSKEYGSVVLPYDFNGNGNTNSNIQAYTLTNQTNNVLTFTDTDEIKHHKPFAFQKTDDNTDANFIMKDASNNFGITVYATRSTNKEESTWDPETHVWTSSTTEIGSPYETDKNDNYPSITEDGWSAKGYYVKETVENDGSTYYILGDKFYHANGPMTVYPHRVTFHNSSTGGAKGYNVEFVANDANVITAIKEAEVRKDLREAEAIYDLQGRKLSNLPSLQGGAGGRPGIHIIRMTDGTVKKVIIK